MGFESNTTETKTMVFTGDSQGQMAHLIIRGVILQGVHSYIYLYRKVNNHLDPSKEVRRQIKIASQVS